MAVTKSQRRTRKRISRGVYRDRWGFSASVYAGGRRAEKRFPPGTPLKDVKAWRDDIRVSLRTAAGRWVRSEGLWVRTGLALLIEMVFRSM